MNSNFNFVRPHFGLLPEFINSDGPGTRYRLSLMPKDAESHFLKQWRSPVIIMHAMSLWTFYIDLDCWRFVHRSTMGLRRASVGCPLPQGVAGGPQLFPRGPAPMSFQTFSCSSGGRAGPVSTCGSGAMNPVVCSTGLVSVTLGGLLPDRPVQRRSVPDINPPSSLQLYPQIKRNSYQGDHRMVRTFPGTLITSAMQRYIQHNAYTAISHALVLRRTRREVLTLSAISERTYSIEACIVPTRCTLVIRTRVEYDDVCDLCVVSDILLHTLSQFYCESSRSRAGVYCYL